MHRFRFALNRLTVVIAFTVFPVVASAQIVVNGHEVVNDFGSYLGGRVQSVLLGETVPIELFIGTNRDLNPSTKPLVRVNLNIGPPGGGAGSRNSLVCSATVERQSNGTYQYPTSELNPCVQRTFNLNAYTFDKELEYVVRVSLTYKTSGNNFETSDYESTILVRDSIAPHAEINGQASTISDTDFINGERVQVEFNWRYDDWREGSVVSGTMSINGEFEMAMPVDKGYQWSEPVFLNDGSNLISLRVVDSHGSITEVTETITVEDKRMPPVGINGRGKTIQGYDQFSSGGVTVLRDTDFLVGENVSVTASTVLAAEFQWYLNEIFVGSGKSTQLALDDGINTVMVTATFEDGRTTEFTYPGGITVNAPSELKMEPVIVNAVQYNGQEFFHLNQAYQNADVSTTDANSSRIRLLKLYKCTSSLVSSCVATIEGITWNGNGLHRFPATYYGTEWIGFSAWSNTNTSNQSEITVFRRLPVEKPSVDDSFDEMYEDSDGLPGEKIVVSPTLGISQLNQSVTLRLLHRESNPEYVDLCVELEFDVCFPGGSRIISVNDGENYTSLTVRNEAGFQDSIGERFTVAAPVIPNIDPVVSISSGNRSISDTDSNAGETVSFTATATDSDGSIASTSWLVGGKVVATGTSANLSLPDGSTTVTFRATDDDGDTTNTSVTVTVASPVIPNIAPVVSIIGGSRTVADSDGQSGETFALTATASDSDGSIASTSWLVGGEVVAIGTSANLSLPDGSTTVIFRATDDDGDTTNTSVTVTVALPVIPNIAPVVSIIGGSRTVADSDGEFGETFALTATASDSDGSIASTSWLVGGEVVAIGTSANLSLPDGSTTVIFRATDDDGDTTNTSVTVTVASPVIPNIAPVVSIIGGSRTVADSDGQSGETFALTVTASDSDGSIASTSWLVGGEVVAIGTSANLSLPDGSTTVTFRATDDDGDTTNTSVTVTVASPVIPNIAPVVSIIGGSRTVADSDGEFGETFALTATASDSDGSIASTSWLVGGEVVAIGTSANLSLPDGSTTVIFRATDDDGDTTNTSVTVTVALPVIPNIAPVVSIIGGSRTVADSDGEFGETFALTATASDSDGSIASTSWLVGGEVVAIGTSANLSLPDGSTTVIFRATDDDGDSTSKSVTITVVAPVIPNVAPIVSISDGNRSISDTDGVAGEVVSVTAAATDSDGELASTSWLIGDEVVASGTSARLPLSDGSTTVRFRATDDDGDSTSTSVTITVEAPVETEEEFVTEYNGIAAPSFLSEEINTISVFDMNKLKLRSCIRLTLRGEPYSLNGYEQYDMNFNLLSLDDLTFRLVDFRPFNLNGSSNQLGETPDCSGHFELSSNVYKDIIAVPGATEAGNLKYDYYDLVIDLIDMDSLLFKLRDISIITGSSSVR